MSSAASATVRVSGPMCAMLFQLDAPGYRSSRAPGYMGTRPNDGLKP
jgi:hypothetical protein